MNECNAELFKGQVVYVGIDVHKNSWRVTEQFGGNRNKTYSMVPSPSNLAQRLNRNYPGAKFKSVYEAGFCGFWIHRELINLGLENIVINPADVATTHKERRYKNDTIDSKKLARELKNGNLTGIHIPSEENLRLRDLVRHETQLVRDISRSKNRIHSHLHLCGKRMESWAGLKLEQMREKSKTEDYALFFLLDGLLKQRKRKLAVVKAEKLLIRELGREEILNNLTSIPGIGFRIGVFFIAEIWDIERFETPDALCAYVGFAPRLVGSGDNEKMEGCGEIVHRKLKSLIIQGAWRATDVDTELKAVYCKLTARGTAQRAVTVVAKKLLLRMRAVWLQNKKYNLNRIQK